MSEYRVNLDVFAGPLDLLLYLVRKEEVDIYDIPIANITEQYLRYIEMLKSLSIDVASEFLVMAATLMQIKSAMLLPRADIDSEGEDESGDPRAELIRQLLEYKKFKDAANLLGTAAEEQSARFNRPNVILEKIKPTLEPEADLEQVSVWDLLEAFETIVQATGSYGDLSRIHDDTPIDLYQVEILHRLQDEGMFTFGKLFGKGKPKLVMVGMFLALLELIRDGLVAAELQDDSKEIYLRPLTDESAEEAVQNAIIANEEHMLAEEQNMPEQQAEASVEEKSDPVAVEQSEDTQTQSSKPPIEIVEIPAVKKEQTQPVAVSKNKIPILEIPPKPKEQISRIEEEAAAKENETATD